MKIVVDTNVVISGIFFGGNPRMIIEAVVDGDIDAFATVDIIEEYAKIIERMVDNKHKDLDQGFLSTLFMSLNVIKSDSVIDVCRDADDNKFIECAVDAKALYIVSGDSDLLDIQEYDGIQIMTAKEFCDRYL